MIFLFTFSDTHIKLNEDLSYQVEIVNLKKILLKAKSQYGDLLFYRTDTHWTELGAYIAYLGFCVEIKDDFSDVSCVDLANIDVRKRPLGNDLAYLANIVTDLDDIFLRLKYATRFESLWMAANDKGSVPLDPYRRIGARERVSVLNTQVSNTLKLMIIKDSFSVGLSHLLNQTFHKVIYIPHHIARKEGFISIILEEKPDILVYEFVERYIGERIWKVDSWLDERLFENAISCLNLEGRSILEKASQNKFLEVLEEAVQKSVSKV